MDAHSRVRYMLHKCNRARREHVASNMLFYQKYLSFQSFFDVCFHVEGGSSCCFSYKASCEVFVGLIFPGSDDAS